MDENIELPELRPVIAGYRIGEEMGRVPLGKIYRARHTETGVWAALRGFTRPEGVAEKSWEAAKDQFHTLLTAHRDLPAHPGIQQILGFGEEDGIFWVATEYFEAKTLHYVLREEGAQPFAWALSAFRQVAEAVDWAGDHGLCHTDLTPFNILFVRDPDNAPGQIHVKVINFGLAHARRKIGSRYAAPEQMTGAEGDCRSDVYSTGVLLTEVLTGRPFIEATAPEEIAARVRAARVPIFPRFWPAYVQNILTAMLAGDPARRYPGVLPAIEDLIAKQNPSFATVPNEHEMTFVFSSNRDKERERVARHSLNLGATVESPRGSAFVYHSLPYEMRVQLQDYEIPLSGQDIVEIRRRLTGIGR